jgi:hypothetical protein
MYIKTIAVCHIATPQNHNYICTWKILAIKLQFLKNRKHYKTKSLLQTRLKILSFYWFTQGCIKTPEPLKWGNGHSHPSNQWLGLIVSTFISRRVSLSLLFIINSPFHSTTAFTGTLPIVSYTNDCAINSRCT